MDINDLSPEELRILEQFDAEEAALDALVFDLSDEVAYQGRANAAYEQWWDFEFPAAPARCSYVRPRRTARS